MRTQLTKITLAASIALALAFTFSFSQEAVRLAEPPEKTIIYDTVHRVIADSVTIKALENSQKFYSDSFYDILWLVGIIIAVSCAVFGSLGIWNWRKARKYNKETKDGLAKLHKELNCYKEMKNELEKKFKEDIENALKKDRTENQKKFDISFRFMSRIYRKLAEGFLGKEPKFCDFFYFMHIFYRCLINIVSLNGYDLDRLKRTHKLFSEKVEGTKNIRMDMPQENKDNVCWFIIYLLKFAKQCDNNKQNEYSDFAKSIYRTLFNFSDFNYDNVRKEIKNCMERDKNENPIEIQEILNLAEDCKNKPTGSNI
jgi:hypothetical protein